MAISSLKNRFFVTLRITIREGLGMTHYRHFIYTLA